MRSIRSVFQDLVDGLEVANNEASLVSAADRVAKRLGFRWFAYLGSLKPTVTIVSSYPRDWVQHYRDEHFDRIDPVVKPSAVPRGAFYWTGDSSKSRTAEQQRLFNEARAFRIRCGVTVPIRGSGHNFAAFTLAADDDAGQFSRFAIEAIETLQLMGLYYHAHVYAKLGLGLNRAEDAPLTPRERQCLAWAAQGKTMAETAEILGITKRTVEFHLDNSRAKLDAVTISQAAAAAARRQLLPF